MKHLLLPIFLILACAQVRAHVDLIVFSFDRPLQLYALLESVEKNVTGIGTTQIIYRVSSERFELGYAIVKQRFPQSSFARQGANPRADFKLLTEKAIADSPNHYVLFAVDDMIVTDYIDMNVCMHALEQQQAYGFYLRMGKNLNHCYTQNKTQPLPKLQNISADIMQWRFQDGTLDWAYPNTVDMTLYRKKDIGKTLAQLPYYSPNTLESCWSRCAASIQHMNGICFQKSKVVNLPLNLVQQDWHNKHMASYATDTLLNLFLEGLKCDIRTLYKINNSAAHMEYAPHFISRD